MSDISVVIADDHPGFVGTVRQILAGVPGIRIVAECGNGTDALAAIIGLSPEIAVLDVEMPGMDGIRLAAHLHRLRHQCRVLLLTMHNDIEFRIRAREARAFGYLLKDSAATELVPAILAARNQSG